MRSGPPADTRMSLRDLKKQDRAAGRSIAAKPRLRFDKVATRLIERLQATLGETVPDGVTVLLTITAPIRLPSKTAAALEDKLQTLLGRGSPGRDEKDTIHGNRVRIRRLRHQSERAPKMIGFVHNSDSDPRLLFDMTRELLELVSAEAGRRAPGLAGDRWLALISAGGISCLEAYRYIYSQLRMATDFRRFSWCLVMGVSGYWWATRRVTRRPDAHTADRGCGVSHVRYTLSCVRMDGIVNSRRCWYG